MRLGLRFWLRRGRDRAQRGCELQDRGNSVTGPGSRPQVGDGMRCFDPSMRL